MIIFLYEFVTGGGMWSAGGERPAGGLLREGAAMLRAVVADFAQLADCQVLTTRDVRLPPILDGGESAPIASAAAEIAAIERLATTADWTLLIAPEANGALAERCRWVEKCGGRLLSPGLATVEVAANKQLTADRLASLGVRIPRGQTCDFGFSLPSDLSFPVVLKPVDGCGSQGVQLVSSAAELAAYRHAGSIRCEEFVPGQPASVAVLCGPAGNAVLPACEQRLSADGRFTYLGGRLPLEEPLQRRAQRLALAAIGALPEPRGFLGVDLVLGQATDGSGDRVIEINPRLTTSYVGLRAACRSNLAAAMLAVVRGEPVDLYFQPAHYRFDADGDVFSG